MRFPNPYRKNNPIESPIVGTPGNIGNKNSRHGKHEFFRLTGILTTGVLFSGAGVIIKLAAIYGGGAHRLMEKVISS